MRVLSISSSVGSPLGKVNGVTLTKCLTFHSSSVMNSVFFKITECFLSYATCKETKVLIKNKEKLELDHVCNCSIENMFTPI